MFERSMFEKLSMNFTSRNQMQYKVTPSIISPESEVNNPSNTCIQLLSNIFGTVEKVVSFNGVLECRHQIPQRLFHKFGFQLFTFGVKLSDYILIFPQSNTCPTHEIYEYFNNIIYYGENISTAECKVGGTKILKMVYPSHRQHEAEQLKSRDSAIHHVEIVTVEANNQARILMDYIMKKTDFAIRSCDWGKISNNFEQHDITQKNTVDKIWFEVELAVRITITTGVTMCVAYLKTYGENQELVDSELGAIKYLVQIFNDNDNFPGILYNFNEGVYIQRVGDVHVTNLTTNPPRPAFKERKLRFLKNSPALSYALSSRESCLCNEESFSKVLKKMRSWECFYGGSRSLESVHPDVQLKTDARIPRLNIVSGPQPYCPSPSSSRSAKTTPGSSPARSTPTASPSRVAEKLPSKSVSVSSSKQKEVSSHQAKRRYLRKESVKDVDILLASEAELYEVPGIDRHTAR